MPAHDGVQVLTPEDNLDLISLTADVVSAHVANNSVHTGEVANLIATVHAAFANLAGGPAVEVQADKAQGAVSVRKSLANPDHIISMIDGKPYKVLRRHLSTQGHTPESYREAFGLPRDYPMVAPNYAAHRSEMAKTIGLGRKPVAQAPVKRGRKPAAQNETPVLEAAE